MTTPTEALNPAAPELANDSSVANESSMLTKLLLGATGVGAVVAGVAYGENIGAFIKSNTTDWQGISKDVASKVADGFTTADKFATEQVNMIAAKTQVALSGTPLSSLLKNVVATTTQTNSPPPATPGAASSIGNSNIR